MEEVVAMQNAAPAPKPPTQIAGVVGIEPERILMNEALETTLPWTCIASLPPFQMFAAERMRNISGKDSELHAQDFIRAKGHEKDLFDEYAAWHEAKGYWPNETPLGAVARKQ